MDSPNYSEHTQEKTIQIRQDFDLQEVKQIKGVQKSHDVHSFCMPLYIYL
jgi:hypothetical protein